MDEIELSLLSHGPGTASMLRPWLDRFATENRTIVDANVFEWEAAWPELVKTALYGHGPDISEIGSTWVGSLITMNALSPFSARDLTNYGGETAFLSSTWQPMLKAGSGSIWAIPWLAYTRLIYYRRDLLEKAGVDESAAFRTPKKLESTLSRLTECGVVVPWCVPTRHSRDTLHNIASWVWNAGGEFISEDGKHILFNESDARAGMRDYFNLYRHLAPPARNRDEADSLFKQGQAAAIISGPWLWPLDEHRPDVLPQVSKNIGVAVPLDAAFIGFSYLVVWKHTRKEALSLKLVRFLSSPDLLDAYSSHTGPLSVRLDALEQSPLADRPNYQTMVRALKTGRTFPQVSLWALVEEKLASALDKIWEDVLAESQPDIDAIMSKHLDPLARRLELTLSEG